MYERPTALRQERHEEVKREFEVCKSRQLLTIIPLAPAALVAFLFGDKGPSASLVETRLAWSAVAVVVAVLLFSFWNWRCPSCRSYLGKRGNPKHCPKCGVELR